MLKGMVKPISEYTPEEIGIMYSLMAEFYNNTDEDVFKRDFYDKDYCLAMYHETDGLVGFTTQKIMEVEAAGRQVQGIFSGDTIIHKKYWGDMELFKVWANFWFDYGETYDEFYWFLICKGYKTYRMLPLFWTEFYPNYRSMTPAYEQSIINAYASRLYPDEYNEETGVIEYKRQKDSLRAGVADIGTREMRNKDIAYFCDVNPDYAIGNDLACLAKIDRNKLKKRAEGILFS